MTRASSIAAVLISVGAVAAVAVLIAAGAIYQRRDALTRKAALAPRLNTQPAKDSWPKPIRPPAESKFEMAPADWIKLIAGILAGILVVLIVAVAVLVKTSRHSHKSHRFPSG